MTCAPDPADILLINPPSGLFYGLGPNFAPIGLFSLAAVLREGGFSVTVLNANYFPDYQTAVPAWAGSGWRRPDEYYYADDGDNPVWERVLAFIDRVDPKLVGFSCHDLAVGGVKRLARILKERSPARVVAVGGPTPAGAPDIFQDCASLSPKAAGPTVDYLLTGEGEVTLLELARSLSANGWRPQYPPPDESGKPIAGLHWAGGEGFTFTSLRPPLADLDVLPDPEREYYWLDYDAGRVVKDAQLNGLATSRGCVKACRFCGARTIWPGPVRYRDIGRVLREAADLRARHGYDFQHFSIFDDDFLARPQRVFDFCRGLAELGDDYIFRCYGRVNNLQDEAVIEALLGAGCQEIWVGVESGSQRVLRSLGKGITVPQIRKLDRLFHNYDFPWLAFIILGTPQEDESDILATLNLLREGHFPAIQPFTFQPYTGTDLFRELREAGRIDYDDIIRGHQNLHQCFSQLVERPRFFELLEELNRLAESRRAAWFRDFYLTPEETEAALDLENRTAAWLMERPGRWLALGPERQLRWLAALRHYRGIAVDLTPVDVDAGAANTTRFGRIETPAEARGRDWAGLLVAAPADQAELWLSRARELAPGAPVTFIGAGGGGGPEGPLYWRRVAELCRRRRG